jgi:two-component system, NarL family, sensor kinase
MAPPVAVATLLAVRRPRNPIGWMLLAIFFVAFAPVGGYAVLDYRMHRGTLPLGWVAVVLGEAWPIFLLLIAVLVWLFPDGQLPAGRWRRVAIVLLAAGVVLGLAASANGVAAVTGHDIRIAASGTLASDQAGVWAVLHDTLVVGVGASWVAWLVLQAPRYRHATGERRQQLKWLYSGGAVFVVSVFGPAGVGQHLAARMAVQQSHNPARLRGVRGLYRGRGAAVPAV